MISVLLLAAALGLAEQDLARAGMLSLAQKVELGYAAQGAVAAPTAPLLISTAAQVQTFYPELKSPLKVIELTLTEPAARAIPGPTVLFNQGLWPYLWQIEDLVFVLAHEAAHLALGHVPERLRQGAGERLKWELAADAEAVARMRAHAVSLGSISALLTRLTAAGHGPADSRQAALQKLLPAPAARPPETRFRPAWRTAVQLWLDHGLTAPPAIFLAAVSDPGDEDLRLQLALRRRQYARAGELAPVTAGTAQLPFRALAAEGFPDLNQARLLWGRWVDGQRDPFQPLVRRFLTAPCRWRQPPPTGLPGRRFAGLVVSPADGWRVALQTGKRLVMTPDHSTLTRLDLWHPGIAPGDEPVPTAGCTHSPLGLWQAIAGLRRELAPQTLTLLATRPLADGWEATLEFTDAAAIQWQALLLRRGVGDAALTALLRAPRRPYFERHRETALAMVLAIQWQ